MIVGKQNIISWFESLHVPYWSLFSKGKVDTGNPIGKSDDRDNVTETEAVESLRKLLDILSRGQFTLIASDKSRVATRGGFRADFEIISPEGAMVTQSNYQISGMPQSIQELDSLTQQRAQQLTENMKLEMKLERLKEENEELKEENKALEKEASKGSNRFWEAINGIGVQNIIAAFATKSAPAVTGVPHVADPPENDVQYAQRLSTVISIFQEADPDWLGTLEKMAMKIKQDPSVIKMFKKFL